MKILKQLFAARRNRVLGIAVGAIILLLIIISQATRDKDGTGGPLTFAVKRGPLTISIAEKGTIAPKEQIILKNEVPGRVSIVYLIPEGEMVTNGQVLVELASTELEEQMFDRQIKVQAAESAFVQAREQLAITTNQASSDIEIAELKLQFAKQDLEKYQGGEYPQELKQAQANIKIREEELQRASEKLKWSRKLFKDQHISQTELQADELAEKKAKLDLELARGDLNLLTNYERKRWLDQLTSDVKQAGMTQERTYRKSKANIIKAEAEFKTKESEFRRQKEKLEEVIETITKTTIRAPSAGQVIYATSVKTGRHWRSNEPLAEGQEVHERQDLIYLPGSTKKKAEISIHETDLKKVKPGMPVTITVDAAPGQNFSGTIARIAPLPDPGSFWSNPDLKVYDTQIDVNGDGGELRNGMTCKAEIIAAHHPDALYIPIQCVVYVGDKPTAFIRKRGGRIEERTIDVGLDDNRMIHVLTGLAEGDDVLLTPPLARGEISRSNGTPPAPPMPATGARGATGRPQGTSQRSNLTAEQKKAMMQKRKSRESNVQGRKKATH